MRKSKSSAPLFRAMLLAAMGLGLVIGPGQARADSHITSACRVQDGVSLSALHGSWNGRIQAPIFIRNGGSPGEAVPIALRINGADGTWRISGRTTGPGPLHGRLVVNDGWSRIQLVGPDGLGPDDFTYILQVQLSPDDDRMSGEFCVVKPGGGGSPIRRAGAFRLSRIAS